MSAKAADLSVVVCCYSEDRWDDLEACVSSLHDQATAPGELILVVDHNPDLLVRARAQFRGLRVIENVGERGLSDARNTGWAAANRDIVAFVDDDATVDHDWLPNLLRHYEEPSVIGVGGSARPLWEGRRPSWFPEEFDWVIGCSYRGMPLAASRLRNLLGCNMSFRRWVFDVAGGFDTRIGRVGDLPVGCEETEFCIRLSQLLPGMHLIYEPSAIALHRVPRARATWSYFRARCYSEGLSKALVSRMVGRGIALESERRYARRVLPAAVVRSSFDAIRHRRLASLRRGMAVIAGLGIAAGGFARGSLSGGFGSGSGSNSRPATGAD